MFAKPKGMTKTTQKKQQNSVAVLSVIYLYTHTHIQHTRWVRHTKSWWERLKRLYTQKGYLHQSCLVLEEQTLHALRRGHNPRTRLTNKLLTTMQTHRHPNMGSMPRAQVRLEPTHFVIMHMKWMKLMLRYIYKRKYVVFACVLNNYQCN